MANGETTNNEIMEFLQEHMVTKEEHKADISALRTDLRETELRLIDKMDEKLATLKGDLTVMMRAEDKKVGAVVQVLKDEKLISNDQAGSILAMEPFPQKI